MSDICSETSIWHEMDGVPESRMKWGQQKLLGGVAKISVCEFAVRMLLEE